MQRRTNTNSLFQKRQLIEPPVDTEGLIDVFKGTLCLSMKQYWEVPGDIAVIATQLDPRLKNVNGVK